MTLLKRMAIPLLILITAGVYWFVSSYEPAGSVLLLLFGIATAVMILALGPTLNDVGPTAPVDPDWHEHRG